jgi:hypothetical protein
MKTTQIHNTSEQLCIKRRSDCRSYTRALKLCSTRVLHTDISINPAAAAAAAAATTAAHLTQRRFDAAPGRLAVRAKRHLFM